MEVLDRETQSKVDAALRDFNDFLKSIERSKCIVCGCDTPLAPGGNVVCSDLCRSILRSISVRAHQRSERQKRKAGISLTDSGIRTCLDCGTDISTRHANAIRCLTCARQREKKIMKARAYEKRYGRPNRFFDALLSIVSGMIWLNDAWAPFVVMDDGIVREKASEG